MVLMIVVVTIVRVVIVMVVEIIYIALKAQGRAWIVLLEAEKRVTTDIEILVYDFPIYCSQVLNLSSELSYVLCYHATILSLLQDSCHCYIQRNRGSARFVAVMQLQVPLISPHLTRYNFLPQQNPPRCTLERELWLLKTEPILLSPHQGLVTTYF